MPMKYIIKRGWKALAAFVLLLIVPIGIVLAQAVVGGGSTQNTTGGSSGGGLTAQTVTNITSSSLTVTGQGSNVLNLESSGSSFNTNAPVFWTKNATNTFNAPTFSSNMTVRGGFGINTNSTTAWLADDYQLWVRPNPASVFPTTARVAIFGAQGSAFNMTDGTLLSSFGFDGSSNYRFYFSGSGLADIYFTVNGSAIPLRMSSTSVTLGFSSSDTETHNGSTGTTPNTFSWNSGQLVLTPTGPATNGNVGMYHRGPVTFASNMVMGAGYVVNRKTVSANYTNQLNDYYLAWKSTSAGTVTNFIATNLLVNGSTLIINDSQRSAFTTNIVVFPIGTTTIMGTNSYPININGQSITITFDGTSNWEIN